MGWASIIAAIIQVVAPIFEKWLQDWLQNKLRAAAPDTPSVGALSARDAKLFLLNKVKADLWWFQTAKLHAVDQAIARVNAA